jgi:hypothetical protein
MEGNIVAMLKPQLDEMTKFIKPGRGKIKNTVLETLYTHDNEQKKQFYHLKKVNQLIKNRYQEKYKESQGISIEFANSKNKLIATQQHHEKVISELNEAGLRYNLMEISALEEVAIRYNLVGDILSAPSPNNAGVREFQTLLEQDFLDFANNDDSLAEEASALLKLQSIATELDLIASFPAIYSKNILAIGGGFSSGKSAFISSFFASDKIQLPIGIRPATAIPAYIIASKHEHIYGYSSNGGTVTIDPKLFEQISHDFVKSFPFNLKDIMPVMAIETPMKQFDNICFIDTPGYNPSDIEDGFTREDKNTATVYLEKANALLWLIGLDAHGTISASDLEFLEQLEIDNKPLYIIANKADLRSDNDLEDILDEISEALEDYDIEFAGISAYSANAEKEYTYLEVSLFDFLESQNSEVEIQNRLLEDIDSVMQMYEQAIQEDISSHKSMLKNLNALELDLLESGYDDYDEKFTNRLEEMKNAFSSKELKSRLRQLEKVHDSMTEAVQIVFSSITKTT